MFLKANQKVLLTIISLIAFLLLKQSGFAQNVDSLNIVVSKTKDPIAKVETLVQLAGIYQSQKKGH